jgi:hypothetical protein
MFGLNLTSDKTLKNVLMLLLVVAVIFIVYRIYVSYSSEGFESRENEKEHFEGGADGDDSDDSDEKKMETPMMPPTPSSGSMEMMTNQGQNPVERDMQNAQMMGMGGSNQLTADDLLPQDKSSVWASVNPEGQGSLADKNFLQAGYHIGINTVGQTLRNANLQLRSEPPCPQVQVSPWLQSTIEPDVSRRPMEIGGCA